MRTRSVTFRDVGTRTRACSGSSAVRLHKVNWLKRTGSVVQIRQRGDVAILWDGRASIDAWPPRALRKEKTTHALLIFVFTTSSKITSGRNTTNSGITIPKPQRMIAVVSLVIIESSTTLHAEPALGDHLLQQNARPLGQVGPLPGIIVFDA